MSIFKATANLISEMNEDRAKRKEQERKERAEAHRIWSAKKAIDDKAYTELMTLIRAHNAKHSYSKVELVQDLPKVKECGAWTIVQDCQDTNCFRHYSEKKEQAMQTASQPETLNQAFSSLFGV